VDAGARAASHVPAVKRPQNGRADADAIAEAAPRPTSRSSGSDASNETDAHPMTP
jgi:hypothetical protein